MFVSAFDEYWNYFRRQNHSALTKEQLRQGDALFGHVDEVLSIASQSPATLVHADLRADNLRINSMRGTVYILDWQLLCRGLGAFDVAPSSDISIERTRQRPLLLFTYLEEEV